MSRDSQESFTPQDDAHELLEQAKLALEACTGPADCCGTANNGQREWPLKLELVSRIQAYLDSQLVVTISTDLSQCKPEDFQHE